MREGQFGTLAFISKQRNCMDGKIFICKLKAVTCAALKVKHSFFPTKIQRCSFRRSVFFLDGSIGVWHILRMFIKLSPH